MTKNILLCDDEFHILRAAEIKFKRAGFDVRTACDGEEGWEQINQQCPDIVITDCQMPRLDGLGLASRILENPTTTGIPVIMLTAKGFELPKDEICSKYGIRDIITKPFSPRELLSRVELILEDQRELPTSLESQA